MTIQLLVGRGRGRGTRRLRLRRHHEPPPRTRSARPVHAPRSQIALSEAFANKWGADVVLAEAFSTSDFKLAASAELDKEMLAQYDELPSVWRQYTTVTTSDFRPKRLQSRWRNTIGFEPVPELTEYPADDRRGATYNDLGGQVRSPVRDLVGGVAEQRGHRELEDLPGELARQARETEMINAVSNLLAVDPTTNTAPGSTPRSSRPATATPPPRCR
jgi:hypothetical protein